MEYFDKILKTHWYWQDLAQGIRKMTFIIGRGVAERQILKKWKWPFLLTECNILKNCCVNIDIDKI